MCPMPLSRKVPRLPHENYLGRVICFLTICCDLRRPHLAAAAFASRVVAILKKCAASTSFLLHAYCVMPDHVHILVEGNHSNADALQFVRIVKIRTAVEFRKARKLRLWEKSFHDHILRRSGALEAVASPRRIPVVSNSAPFPADLPISVLTRFIGCKVRRSLPSGLVPGKPADPP